jgi:hypothetical protein
MTDHFARPERAATSRVAELNELCRQDYLRGEAERAAEARTHPSALPPAHEPTTLGIAIRAAQQLLTSDQVPALREALRLLLRALNAEPATTRPASAPPAVLASPAGPGCGAPATVCIEGYSPRDGRAHGSLDHAVYACAEHAPLRRALRLHRPRR